MLRVAKGKIIHTFREGNTCVDFLANEEVAQYYSFIIMDTSPPLAFFLRIVVRLVLNASSCFV